ncbi:hypothetical protein AAFP35_16900 [Gordonia sp. CPCC 206044]|uniref:hypothetical protein n=1 Tax=Gordonia sp. CPCC 206044 TaxID=3140793 RepID=UPI003AF3C05A
MFSDALAAAGLQDCADYPDACHELNDWFRNLLIGLVGLSVGITAALTWLVFSVLATIDIIATPTGTRRGIRWIAVAWLVPIIGALRWYKLSRPPHTSTSAQE